MLRSFLIVCVLKHALSILDPTYFDALKIKPFASPAEIEEAYKKRKEVLLEKSDDKAIKKLAEVQEAYKVLIDENQRAKYERFGKAGMRLIDVINKEKYIQFDLSDYRKGKLITIRVPVRLNQIFEGANITLSMNRNTICPHCQGYGSSNPSAMKVCPKCEGSGIEFSMVEVRNGFREKRDKPCSGCAGVGKLPGKKCHYCKGNKVINELQDFTVHLEKGLPNGNVVTLRNLGDEKAIGAPSDIQVIFEQTKQGQWKRVGKDLHYQMDISLYQSIFGLKREIQHIDGRSIPLNLAEGTIITPDSRKVIQSEGFAQKNGVRGNLVVRFKIVIQKFSEDQLDLWDVYFESQ